MCKILSPHTHCVWVWQLTKWHTAHAEPNPMNWIRISQVLRVRVALFLYLRLLICSCSVVPTFGIIYLSHPLNLENEIVHEIESPFFAHGKGENETRIYNRILWT